MMISDTEAGIVTCSDERQKVFTMALDKIRAASRKVCHANHVVDIASLQTPVGCSVEAAQLCVAHFGWYMAIGAVSDELLCP
jgi:hypothetical protein